MNVLKCLIGILFAGIGIVVMGKQIPIHTHQELTGFQLASVMLGLGGLLVKKGLQGKALLPAHDVRKRMLDEAGERALIGASGLVFLLLCVTTMILGTQAFFGYNFTSPQLSIVTDLALLLIACIQIWRYAYFIQSAARNQGPKN